jgi:hypothetical protein
MTTDWDRESFACLDLLHGDRSAIMGVPGHRDQIGSPLTGMQTKDQCAARWSESRLDLLH